LLIVVDFQPSRSKEEGEAATRATHRIPVQLPQGILSGILTYYELQQRQLVLSFNF
jgi:hypothetical protein